MHQTTAPPAPLLSPPPSPRPPRLPRIYTDWTYPCTSTIHKYIDPPAKYAWYYTRLHGIYNRLRYWYDEKITFYNQFVLSGNGWLTVWNERADLSVRHSVHVQTTCYTHLFRTQGRNGKMHGPSRFCPLTLWVPRRGCKNCASVCVVCRPEDVPLMEFMYLVFIYLHARWELP